MRNLRIIQRSDIDLSDSSLPLTASSWESRKSILCTFGPSAADPTIKLCRIKQQSTSYDSRQLIASWAAPCPSPDLDSDEVISLQYFSDSQSCCIVLAGGDIILIRENVLPGEEHIEILGTVDDGITAATWSPDEELLAICTNTSSFILMSREFESIVDVAFSSDDFKASKHVSVGWGKAETQFKGKRAKALRDPTIPEHVDEGLPSIYDDGRSVISWRGDGEYVAVNSKEDNGRRVIRVFSRDGSLDSVSEPVDYLEGALSWRPAGNLIAGIKRAGNNVEIVFFERNGLRHGQFPLHLSESDLQDWGSIIGLDWNPDSTVLAVIFNSRIQFWTMGNYHYYLKQTILIPRRDRTDKRNIQIRWNIEVPLLLVTHHEGHISICEFVFAIAKGSTTAPYDSGIVAVIDGRSLKLTPLRYANIPPPMSLHELQLSQDAVDVHINSVINTIAVLTVKSIELFSYKLKKAKVCEPEFLKSIAISSECGIPRQVILMSSKILSILCDGVEGRGRVFCCQFDDANTSFHRTESLTNVLVSNILTSLDDTQSFSQSESGHIFQNGQNSDPHHKVALKFPQYCPWTNVILNDDLLLAIGLTQTGALYVNDHLIARNCTSFLTTAAHLIFTTTTHLLKFVHLAAVDDLEIPLDEPEKDERCRSIERGARLVTAMPSTYSLVLQMPRGNLETIYPRALVLAGIRKSIESQDYKTAFLACRSHRVDMNIIHDHDPHSFMQNVKTFVDQVHKAEYIDLFLSQLKEEDVSQTMYRDTVRKKDTNPLFDVVGGFDAESTSKINNICDAFLRALQDRANPNLLNIITAHVCKSPPDLDGGLLIISKLTETSQEKAEDAVEHICFLADANQLYDHALGIYDLEVALLVAQQTQKAYQFRDPREYLPYMRNLQEMTILRRNFTIDNDLKRYEKALTNLYNLDVFDEFKEYTQKNELYSHGLELYRYQGEKLNDLMRLYADFLNDQRSFKKAGIAYEYLENHVAAIQSYRQANLWREALYCAELSKWQPEKIKTLANELAESLEESKDFQAAATIHIDYLNSVEMAIKLLCRTYQFAEATRVAISHKRPDLLESSVDSGLLECFNTTTELIADCKSQIGAQVPRLRELRIKKEREPLAFYSGDPSATVEGDIPDDVSLAPTDTSTSGETFLTRYTGRSNSTLNTQTTRRTSKHKRREERKRARGKKGTIYEEEYLVNSISRLIERMNSINDDVIRLIEGLIKRRMREQARAVEKAMLEVIHMCKSILGEVFSTVVSNIGDMATPEIDKPTGGDAVLHDTLRAIQTPKVIPVVKEFERLTI